VRLIGNLGFDELGQKNEGFLPAEIASLGGYHTSHVFLDDVQFSPTRHLLQNHRHRHHARQSLNGVMNEWGQVFQIAEIQEFDDPSQVMNEEAHVRTETLEAGLKAVESSPKKVSSLDLIVRRRFAECGER
jgi:hypothetical protein